jgi:hypothetical protein
MDPRIEQQLKKLDVNNDGKVDMNDAKALFEIELGKQKPTVVASASFIGGLVIGFFAGRASK